MWRLGMQEMGLTEGGPPAVCRRRRRYAAGHGHTATAAWVAPPFAQLSTPAKPHASRQASTHASKQSGFLIPATLCLPCPSPPSTPAPTCSEDDERAEAASQLAQHKGEYARLQAALKEAALAQRAAALRSAQEERKELLAGGEAALRQRRAQAQGDVVAAAEDVTGGLRRTRQVSGCMGGRASGWVGGVWWVFDAGPDA